MNAMQNDEQHKDLRADIVRYLAGEMSEQEVAAFVQQLETDHELQQLYEAYRKVWDGVDHIREQDAYDLDAEWARMERLVDFDEEQTAGLRGVQSDGSGLTKKVGSGVKQAGMRSIRTNVLRIAAVLLIGLAGISGFFILRYLASYEKVMVAESTGSVSLEDGTEVTLNQGSVIRYSMEDRSDRRRVILKGEAFFEVARDTARPFVIEAGSALVEVLGTSFNVEAYKERSTIEVTVRSGLVSMAVKGSGSNQLILHKGNKGIYDKKTGTLELIESAGSNDFAWKTMELNFSQAPLSEVVSAINEAYRTGIEIGNPALRECPITVSFSKQDLSTVIQVLVNTLDLRMERENGNIVLTGEGCRE